MSPKPVSRPPNASIGRSEGLLEGGWLGPPPAGRNELRPFMKSSILPWSSGTLGTFQMTRLMRFQSSLMPFGNWAMPM